ncbi:MAG: hypothetical protein PF637_09725 [Spirochaetes bacterium]|jgi:hypothetical protein|nr:hypothetical protein [Spirochaetota bacterium]
MIYYNASDYNIEELSQIKRNKCAVIFSTYGEREADLLCEKIDILKHECSSLLDHIIVSHRRTSETCETPDKTESMVLKQFPDVRLLLCNSYTVSDMGNEAGKGADMRRALHYCITELDFCVDDCIVYLDADVSSCSFNSSFFYALAAPVLTGTADFSKASFYREMGRVRKFVAQPLFSIIEHELLSGLSDFGYPLSGEVAGNVGFFTTMQYWQLYGVETGIDFDAVINQARIADVNLGYYDHIHSSDESIQKMCFGIMRTYFKKLEEYGFIELKRGAKVADLFRSSMIDNTNNRKKQELALNEKSYQPLNMVCNINGKKS